jgi:hypothetical protein
MATEENSMTISKSKLPMTTKEYVYDKLIKGGIQGLILENIKIVPRKNSYLIVVTSGMDKNMRNLLK